MNKLATETFIDWCDDMMIAEEGKVGLLAGTFGVIASLIGLAATGVYHNIKSQKEIEKKKYAVSNKKEKTQNVKSDSDKISPNFRNRENYWENEYAKIENDYFDKYGCKRVEKVNKEIPNPTPEQLKQAQPVIKVLSEFEKEMIKVCDKANKDLNFPNEFTYISPGQYCLCGDDKEIVLTKHFAGYECYDYFTKRVNSASSPEEKEAALSKLEKVFEEFESSILNLVHKYGPANNPQINKTIVWYGKDNVECSPLLKRGYRIYWVILIDMKL